MNLAMTRPIDYAALLEAVRDQMSLDLDSVHGPDHWRQVALNGLLLAQETGADPVVVRLFALFHDARRLDEWTDPEHGPRGGELALAWCGVRYELDDRRLGLLVRACRAHTSAQSPTGDVTVDTCIDADRLDLPRVGMMPDPERLLTDPARRLACRALSEGVSLGDYRSYLRSFVDPDYLSL